MSPNILIIGITGFLGRNIAKVIWHEKRDEFNIIGIGLSPGKINYFKTIRRNWGAIEPDIPVFCIDIVHDQFLLEKIFQDNKIDYVIHAAAQKYMDIAEKDPTKTIEINIIGTLNILNLAKKYNVKNLIALSTDKANKPINVYGMTKYLMEKSVQQYGYTIYQGVNFFWSDGSVVDIWYRQIKTKSEICVTNMKQERYYSNILTIVYDILANLDNTNTIILPSYIFRIKLKTLFTAMTEKFEYDKDKYFLMGDRENEKIIEDLRSEQTNDIKELDKDAVKSLLTHCLKNVELSSI